MNRFPMSYAPVLEWRRYSVTAGMAHYQHGMITLSVVVLKNPVHIRETLLHEYAHLLAFDRHGKRGAGHGKHWRQAMIDLGLEELIAERVVDFSLDPTSCQLKSFVKVRARVGVAHLFLALEREGTKAVFFFFASLSPFWNRALLPQVWNSDVA